MWILLFNTICWKGCPVFTEQSCFLSKVVLSHRHRGFKFSEGSDPQAFVLWYIDLPYSFKLAERWEVPSLIEEPLEDSSVPHRAVFSCYLLNGVTHTQYHKHQLWEFWFIFFLMLVMFSIFFWAYWPFVYLLWRNAYSRGLPILKSGYLVL